MLGESAATSRFQTGGILEAYCPAPVHHCLLQYCFSHRSVVGSTYCGYSKHGQTWGMDFTNMLGLIVREGLSTSKRTGVLQ